MKLLLMLVMLCAPSIFDYRNELKLTPTQVQEMKRLLKELLSEQEKSLEQEGKWEKQYRQLVVGSPSESEVLDLLRRIESSRTSRRFSDFRISQQIIKLLSPEQLKRWRELQSKSQK